MPGWIGPTVALSLLVIALAVVAVTATILMAIKELMEHGQSLAKEVRELRTDLAPTLDAVKRLGEKGLDVVQLAEDEARGVVETARRIRYDVERGVKRAKRRLADLDAVVGVAQEELDSTVVEVAAALQTARAGAGMIGQLRRLVRPRRRGAA
jgi:Sec-independent protein translocase protein TatA